MRIKIRKLMDGPGPGEALVEITTSSGNVEQVVVHDLVIEDDMIEVGYPIHENDDYALIELPREAMSGSWRVWIPRSEIDAQ